MAVINRRNAILGWSVWQLAKAIAKKKARDARPGTGEHAGLNKGAIATILAAVIGAIVFWRLKADSEQTA
jgi:hypothetical protein